MVLDIRYTVGVIIEVGAAVLIIETVLILGLDRTFILGIGYAVLVIIQIGTAVGILETVNVFGILRASVNVIFNAVMIIILNGDETVPPEKELKTVTGNDFGFP